MIMANMSMLRILTCLAATATLMELAMAVSHTVGGTTGGWDTVTNLQAWAASQTFSPGDSLFFQNTANHNVLEVSKADYDSCETTNPIKTYTDTASTVPLTSPGSQYFICGSPGHCSIGMKMEIGTLAIAAKSPPPPPSSSTPPQPSLSPPPPSSSPPPPPSSSEDVDDPIAPAVSTPTPLPSYGPAISPFSPSYSPANSPTSTFIDRTNSNTYSPSAATKENVMVNYIVGLGFFMATVLVL